MGKNQRQDEIVKLVDRAGTVTVADIVETIKVCAEIGRASCRERV